MAPLHRQVACAILVAATSAAACTARPAPGLKLPEGSETIAIGELQSLSGPLAARGQAFHRGLERGLAEQNALGGIQGRPLVLHVLDDRGRPDEARLGMRRLVEETRVIAVLGGASAEITGAAQGATRGVPFLSPQARPQESSGTSFPIAGSNDPGEPMEELRQEQLGYAGARQLVAALLRARTVDAPDLWRALRSTER